MHLETLITLITPVFSILGTVAGLAWWLSSQFSKSRHAFHNAVHAMQLHLEAKMEKQEVKMDRHEDNDVQRFKETHDRLRNIEMRNAARDGLISTSVTGH